MRIFKFIENGIEYEAIECCGPLEYVDAKCFIFENKNKNCMIFLMNIQMYGLTASGGITHLIQKEYYKNRKLHRNNGPAIENLIDKKMSKYYLDGVKIDVKKYFIKLRKEKIKRLNKLSKFFILR